MAEKLNTDVAETAVGEAGHGNAPEKEEIHIGQVRDVNNKEVFKNHVLCAQFLRDYAGLDILSNVQPEDIEDVTDRYYMYLGVEFEADTVKRIRIPELKQDVPIYLVSLIEHKSKVDYNVSMQLLRYMVCIWDDYAKTMKDKNLGLCSGKDFRYPPIFPIVYYEGTGEWTAAMNVSERIFMNEIFASYIPNFTYRLVNVHQYTNEQLLIHEDEMSLLMMINRIQTPQDFNDFINSNQEEIRGIVDKASESIVQIIVNAFWSLFMKMQVSVKEATDCLKKMIGGSQMGNWFENMEAMNIQEERAKTKVAEENLAKAEEKLGEAETKLGEAETKLGEAETKLQESQKSIVQLVKELAGDKTLAVQKLMEDGHMTKEEAEAIVERNW